MPSDMWAPYPSEEVGVFGEYLEDYLWKPAMYDKWQGLDSIGKVSEQKALNPLAPYWSPYESKYGWGGILS